MRRIRRTAAIIVAVCVMFVGALGVGMGIALFERIPYTLSGHRWVRTIPIEQELLMRWEGTEVPEGARVISQHREQRGTRTVVIEIGENRGSPAEVRPLGPCIVRLGWLCAGSGGSGQEEIRVEVPNIVTVYTYEAMEWVETRSVSTKGRSPSDSIQWPEVTLAPGEREGERREFYWLVIFGEGSEAWVDVPREVWESYEAGDTVYISRYTRELLS